MKKVTLIKPDKTKHKYVVGIDFGHGETSAAICELEWDKSAGQREANIQDVIIDYKAGKPAIPSAICKVKEQIFIGEDAFEYTTDNDDIRIGFKQCPQSLDGEAETLMCDFMHAVYQRILEIDDRLSPTNHIVYIARPSGWIDEDVKELYRQMAKNAGIPLAGLTSESRAAIFYAKSPTVNFARDIDNGAIVFDLGSSTLDFTYLSDKDSPKDFGYDLGASIIDKALYFHSVLGTEDVKTFVNNYPEYSDALLYQVRKFKEEVYGKSESSKLVLNFRLGKIIPENAPSYDEYERTEIYHKFKNLQEFNDLVEDETSYQQRIADALIEFKEKHIKGKTINGVFLTLSLQSKASEASLKQTRQKNNKHSIEMPREILTFVVLKIGLPVHQGKLIQ